MLMASGLLVAGLVALVAGAEALVRGASKLALSLGITPLVVGLTIVAFGTSSPEVAVSIGAALDGKADLAVGNVVGSNIFNTLFILGVSALITPLVVHAQIVRQEVPIMIGASVLLLAMVADLTLGRLEAALLLLLLVGYTSFLVVQSRRAPRALEAEFVTEMPRAATWDAHWAAQVGLVAVGLVLLVLGSDWLVGAAITFARAFGVSDLVIGLTIVAAGTSMPEVATSVMAAVRGERDIAVGNVIGSNTFNILGSLGVSGLVSSGGLPIAPALVAFDVWVMLAVAVACLPIFLSRHEIERWEGGVFLAYYVAYTAYLVLAAQSHDALPAFSAVMLWFAVPLTVVTLVVVGRSARASTTGPHVR